MPCVSSWPPGETSAEPKRQSAVGCWPPTARGPRTGRPERNKSSLGAVLYIYIYIYMKSCLLATVSPAVCLCGRPATWLGNFIFAPHSTRPRARQAARHVKSRHVSVTSASHHVSVTFEPAAPPGRPARVRRLGLVRRPVRSGRRRTTTDWRGAHSGRPLQLTRRRLSDAPRAAPTTTTTAAAEAEAATQTQTCIAAVVCLAGGLDRPAACLSGRLSGSARGRRRLSPKGSRTIII